MLPFGGGFGGYEMIIFGVIALLLFGKRLPEVARSLGKGVVEFKRGVQGIEQEVHQAGSYSAESVDSAASRPMIDDEAEPVTAPRFEPPESPPA